MLIQEVLKNLDKQFTNDKYRRCPWERRFVNKDLLEKWINKKATITSNDICLPGSCNDCYSTTSDKIVKLPKDIIKHYHL